MVRNCYCRRQPAGASDGRSVETFLWDGLALIRRDGTNIVNEPAVTGGNPVIAGDKTLFNDMLGSTLGAKTGGEFSVIERDAFGQTETASDYDFFTGKPHIGELGYAFLFRNYRANLGKWQTADPMGYPDGWNNLAYVNNNVTKYIDWQGAAWVLVDDKDPYHPMSQMVEGEQRPAGPGAGSAYSNFRTDIFYQRSATIVSRTESWTGGTPSPGDTNVITTIYDYTEMVHTIVMGFHDIDRQWMEVSRDISAPRTTPWTVTGTYVWVE